MIYNLKDHLILESIFTLVLKIFCEISILNFC